MTRARPSRMTLAPPEQATVCSREGGADSQDGPLGLPGAADQRGETERESLRVVAAYVTNTAGHDQ